MAELTSKERLLPSLLDRLTDDEPHKKEESRDQRSGNVVKLRASVLRDLEWLMNTTNLGYLEGLEESPYVRRSVINYGLPPFSGISVKSKNLSVIQRAIKEAIVHFEPRILEETLAVSIVDDDPDSHSGSAVFQIEGMMWGRPMPEALFLRTEMDLEIGDTKIKEV